MITDFKAFQSAFRFILHFDGNDDIYRISAAACAPKQMYGRTYVQTPRENVQLVKKFAISVKIGDYPDLFQNY